jgi:hypothetical protein
LECRHQRIQGHCLHDHHHGQQQPQQQQGDFLQQQQQQQHQEQLVRGLLLHLCMLAD